MLAILRHAVHTLWYKDELKDHCFQYQPTPPARKYVNRVKQASKPQEHQPLSGNVSLFHGGDQSKPWVQSALYRVQLLKQNISDPMSF
ncbi:MAG TPA: hypothetical protein DD636_02615 [Anaerolineaceae bacterium]|nr:hypothetical protein [Anaerolineaceae bacterium]